MALFAAGLSHKNAPVALREQLAVDGDKLCELLRDAVTAGVVREAVLLSTCNRVEIYGVADAAGTVLTPSDIEMKMVPLKYAESTGIVSLDPLVGTQLDRSGRAGLMLRAGDVEDPQVVTRTQMVTVYLKSGPMTLTVKGQALNNAAAGQPVQVMNTASKKIVIGTALPNGGVEMTTTTNVAGL